MHKDFKIILNLTKAYETEDGCAFVVGGHHPYSRDAAPQRQVAAFLRSSGTAAFADAAEAQAGPLPATWRADLLASDVNGLAGASEVSDYADDLGDAVAGIVVPSLLYASDRDPYHPLAQRAAAMPRAEFFSLPDLDHWWASAHTELVLPRVQEFLTQN